MTSKTTNKFSPEVRARAVRMVAKHEAEHPSRWAAVSSIAAKIGCSAHTLHEWVKKAEVDSGKRAGMPSDMAEKMKALERENRELRQANEILRKASAYFAQAELDRPLLRRHCAEAAAFMSAAANAKRLSILQLLTEREHSVGELSILVGLSQSALSQHLSKLRRGRLVETRREAQTIYYSSTSPDVAKLLSTLEGIFPVIASTTARPDMGST